MTINLEQVKEPNYAIEKGTYTATVQRAEVTKTGDGRPMLSVGFQITGPEHAGKYVWGNWVLDGAGSEMGLPRVRDFVAAVSNANLASVNLDAVVPNSVGFEVVLEVYRYVQKTGDYAGQYTNGIGKITRKEA